MPPHTTIIVGAGSSGCVLAHRLTAPPTAAGCRVILLETGGDVRTAARGSHMVSPNPMDVIGDDAWSFNAGMTARRTTAQQPATYWRGKGVGGSSSINGMQAIRGTPEDFDSWTAAGCEGWGADDVLPFYKLLETDLDFGQSNPAAHGSAGPLPIGRHSADQSTWGGADRAFYAACSQGLGWAEVPDHNAFERGAVGVSRFARNDVLPNNRGESGTPGATPGRVSAADAWLDPIREDPANPLEIRTGLTVERILFDEATGQRAIGVVCRRETDGGGDADGGGELVEVLGDEVILCAGAVHSPAILQRSGIGPAPLLQGLGVAVRAELPVGENFQDHPGLRLAIPLAPHAQVSMNMQGSLSHFLHEAFD